MGERIAVLSLAVLLVVAAGSVGSVGTQEGESDGSLDVYEPRGFYFAGQEIELRGAAAVGIDAVAVYVRDQGDWELVDVNEDGALDEADTISVGDEGVWAARNVVLSNASPMLQIPGEYRFGVVDAVDARRNGTLQRTIPPDQFISATSTQTILTVNAPRLEGTFRAIGGEVATDDGEVAVQGIARGMEEVLAVVVDSRGRIATAQVSTRGRYDVIDADVTLRTADDRPLGDGPVTAFLIGLGRDSVAGDGQLPGQSNASLDDLEAYVTDLPQLDPRQMRERILEETVEDAASDDVSVTRNFEYATGRTQVEAVVPVPEEESADLGLPDVEQVGVTEIEAGETILVRGRTNRKPDDNTIRVEAIDGPTIGRMPVAGTDDWGSDGIWSVTIDTDGVDPGVYSFAVSVGNETVDRVQISIAPPSERGSGNETAKIEDSSLFEG